MDHGRKLSWAIALLSTALLCVTDAQAQQRKGQQGKAQGGGMGMGMGMGMTGPGMISLPAVEKELKLTNEQKEKAKSFAEEYREKGQEMRSQLEGLDRDERMAKMQELTRAHYTTGMKDVEAMLKPEQTKRFKQIVFQTRGTENFTDPAIVKMLKMTDAQKDKVKNALESSQSEMREAMQDAQGDRQEMATQMTKIRKETTAKVMALMSPEQITMYNDMAGEKFDLPAMPMGRGNR